MLKTVGFPSTRTGDQTIINGDLVIGTAGNGIDFTANGGAVLNQYDEDTWVPVLSSEGGGETVTYTTRLGTYVKVGNLVQFNLFIKINTVSGGSGNIRISLPFVNKDFPDFVGYPVVLCQITGEPATIGNVFGGQSYLQPLLAFSALAGGDEIRVSGTYQSA